MGVRATSKVLAAEPQPEDILVTPQVCYLSFSGQVADRAGCVCKQCPCLPIVQDRSVINEKNDREPTQTRKAWTPARAFHLEVSSDLRLVSLSRTVP